MTRGAKNRAGERGMELFEAAFSLLVFLCILLGIMDFGRAVYEYHFVANAARQAARWASVRGSTSCPTGISSCNASASDVRNYVKNTLATGGSGGYDAGNTTVNTSWPRSTPNCPAGGAQNAPLCDVKVAVTYNFSFILFPGKLLPGLPGTFSMTSTSDMIISQ